MAFFGLRSVTSGQEQPAFEQATAHAGYAGVYQGKQCGGILAAQGLYQFQIAPGGVRQVDVFIRALNVNAVDVRERPSLGVFGITQQCSGTGMCQ